MELFTLDQNFHKQEIIDGFLSLIWTERYYGNSEIELVTSLDSGNLANLPIGTFVGISESNEVMILESANMEDNKLKLKGISLLSWLNNRFIRGSNKHEDRYFSVSGPPGQILWDLVYNFTNAESTYLNGTVDIGIPNPERFAIPGLDLRDFDSTGDEVQIGVPYGPLYKALSDIATTYEIGMQITLDEVTDESYFLGFRSYRGLDRTSDQSVNPVVRFSPDMESFSNIKEVQSISSLKTEAYTFAPGNPDGMATTPGIAKLSGDQYTGFDLRAIMVLAEDITTDMVEGDPAKFLEQLNNRSEDALKTNKFVKAVDGEIAQESQLKYGIHYNLGDVIEVQGNSGTVSAARVTEYIRSQDSGGETAYPTVAAID